MTLIFYSLPYSHYVDAARWALQLCKIEYTEEAYLPWFHRVLGKIYSIRNTRMLRGPT